MAVLSKRKRRWGSVDASFFQPVKLWVGHICRGMATMSDARKFVARHTGDVATQHVDLDRFLNRSGRLSMRLRWQRGVFFEVPSPEDWAPECS